MPLTVNSPSFFGVGGAPCWVYGAGYQQGLPDIPRREARLRPVRQRRGWSPQENQQHQLLSTILFNILYCRSSLYFCSAISPTAIRYSIYSIRY